MNKIYTIGYSGISQADLVKAIQTQNLKLVDIRFRAGSRIREWNKSKLIEALGERYEHLREFGNANYRSNTAEVKLLDAEAGIERATALLEAQSIVLMCACKDVETCHRKVAADLLAEATGSEVVHWRGDDLAG